MGLEKADKGEFEVGETVKVAYVDQQHKDIDLTRVYIKSFPVETT